MTWTEMKACFSEFRVQVTRSDKRTPKIIKLGVGKHLRGHVVILSFSFNAE